MKFISKTIFTLVIISVIGLTTHIYLQKFATPLISNFMAGKTVVQPPYPFNVLVSAYATAILPVAGLLIIYNLISSSLKFDSRILKGLVFGGLVLLSEGKLIREPVMNAVVGNPWEVVLLDQIQSWLPTLVICLLIALMMPVKNYKNDSNTNE
jgi:hypothetical protein